MGKGLPSTIQTQPRCCTCTNFPSIAASKRCTSTVFSRRLTVGCEGNRPITFRNFGGQLRGSQAQLTGRSWITAHAYTPTIVESKKEFGPEVVKMFTLPRQLIH
jgi:hypothetical protein